MPFWSDVFSVSYSLWKENKFEFFRATNYVTYIYHICRLHQNERGTQYGKLKRNLSGEKKYLKKLVNFKGTVTDFFKSLSNWIRLDTPLYSEHWVLWSVNTNVTFQHSAFRLSALSLSLALFAARTTSPLVPSKYTDFLLDPDFFAAYTVLPSHWFFVKELTFYWLF